MAKARKRLDKAKALLEEARALVTVYVVRRKRRYFRAEITLKA